MDFQTRVEALTSLTISTSPTTTELSQYLNDGVDDVARRLKELAPMELLNFSTVAAAQTNEPTLNGFFLFAELSDGTLYHPCSQINPSDSKRYLDTNSLYKASYINPKCWVMDGKLYTAPAMDASYPCNVHYYTSPTVLFSDSTITNFPTNYLDAVVIYASIKSLGNYMGNELITNKDVDDYKNAHEVKMSLTKDYEMIFAPLIKQQVQA